MRPGSRRPRSGPVIGLSWLLAALSATAAVLALLSDGGPGRQTVQTARGATVTLYGEGLFAADTWLQGAGNVGQEAVILLVEVPLLITVLWWYRRGGQAAAVVLAGVLAFFGYYYVSMTFGVAQNQLFAVYVACASLSLFALVFVASRLEATALAHALPERPGPAALASYLFAVAAALLLAWLPPVVATTWSGEVASKVGPYTSSVTDALDLGLVVPVAVLAGVQVVRRTPSGRVLAVVMLVVNVCIGLLLMGQALAQVLAGVPLTPGEIVTKVLTFAVLTLVAGGLLARMAIAGRAARRDGVVPGRSAVAQSGPAGAVKRAEGPGVRPGAGV